MSTATLRRHRDWNGFQDPAAVQRPRRFAWEMAVAHDPISPIQWQVETLIHARREATWEAIDDLSLIPDYHPVVGHVELPQGVERRQPGVEYRCVIPSGPGKGWCVEKVIDHVPLRRTTVAFTADSWGLTRLIDGFLTEIEIEPRGESITRVILTGRYRPRGWKGAILNVLVLRRRMCEPRPRDDARFQAAARGAEHESVMTGTSCRMGGSKRD